SQIQDGKDWHMSGLRAAVAKYVAEHPTWKAGDWAWWDGRSCSGAHERPQVVWIDRHRAGKGYCHVRLFPERGGSYGVSCSSLRPLTDEDWTGEIGGVRVRAYDDADGSIRVVCADDTSLWAFDKGNNDDTVLRTLCREHNIPIMPYSLSKGDFKKPEVKK
ncbi:MAG: hypothetical protein M0P69_20560, partial [Bacteroidales bacterium]|nr:hypothetical protein [Bacteroidales bacterium]